MSDDLTLSHAPGPPSPDRVTPRPAPNGSGLSGWKATVAGLDPAEAAAAVRADQRQRWRAGQRVPLEDYLAARPDLDRDPSVLLDLVYSEFLLGEEVGAGPTPDAYARRFPAVAGPLAAQLDLYEALKAAPGTDTAPAGRPTADDPAGRPLPVIAGYELLDELGRGGMGVVYRARQVGLNRVVALKTLPEADPAGGADAVRFLAEADAVAAIRHPQVVSVFEFGRYSGQPYLAMEYLAGGSLRDRLRGALRMLPKEAAALVAKVARGVQAAHDQQVVHRDLKPANVLFDERGEPKVTDFGLARRGGGAGLTRTQAVMGTPAYMAPEQAEGKGRFVGPAADVWALGVILYECLTGTVPFPGDDPFAVMRQLVQDDPDPPRRRNPAVPRDLEMVCLKCLRKDPADRYPAAADLAADLDRFAAGVPVSVRAPGPVERAVRWARRHPSEASLAGAIAALLVAAAVGASLTAVWMRRQQKAAEDNEQRARTAEDVAKRRAAELAAAEEGLRLELIRSNRSVTGDVRGARLRGEPGRHFTGIVRLREALALARRLSAPAEDVARIRDEMMNLYASADAAVEHTWVGLAEGSAGAYFSPTLDRYVLLDHFGKVVLRAAPGGREITPFPTDTLPAKAAVFAPDGKSLLLFHPPPLGLSVWRVDEDRPTRLRTIPEAADGTFLSDGRVAAQFAQGPGAVRVVAGEPGPADQAIPDVRLLPGRPAHPTRPLLAVARNGRLAVVNVETGSVVADADMPTGEAWGVAWHPTRPVLAYPSGLTVQLWDVPAGTRAVLHGHTQSGIRSGFDPTGELVVGIDWSGVMRVWDARTGTPLLSLPTGWANQQFAFDAKGERLAAGVTGDQLKTFRVRPAAGLRVSGRAEPEKDGFWPYLCVSPDGRLGAAQNGVRCALFDPATGSDLGDLPDTWRPVRFLADGSLVTIGPKGTLRWPVRHLQGRCRVGPPSRLTQASTNGVWSATPDGLVMVEPRFGEGLIVHGRAGPGKWARTPPQTDVRYSDVSPDGRWAAAGSHEGGEVAVYATDTGHRVAGLAKGAGPPRFGPDGRSVAVSVSNGKVKVFETDGWRERWAADGNGTAFSPDGRLLAVGEGTGVVQLRAVADGRVVARLEVPDPSRLTPVCFGPGGTLLATGADDHKLYVWDLPVLRSKLKGEGLDWEWPEFAFPEIAPGPDRVEVVALGVAEKLANEATAAVRAGDAGTAADRVGRLRALDPDDSILAGRLAEFLLWGPAACYDPAGAAAYARRAADRRPDLGLPLLILGAAEHDLGRHRAAVESIERGLKVNPRAGFVSAYYALARSRLKTGDLSGALAAAHEAVQAWVRRAAAVMGELGRLR